MALAAEKELEHIGETVSIEVSIPAPKLPSVSQEHPQSAEETLTLEIRKHDDVRVS